MVAGFNLRRFANLWSSVLVDALADMWRVSGTFVGGVPLVGGLVVSGD